MAAEILDLFLEMQKTQQDEIGTGALQVDDSLGHLPWRADQV